MWYTFDEVYQYWRNYNEGANPIRANNETDPCTAVQAQNPETTHHQVIIKV
jgi:hypothetical protein